MEIIWFLIAYFCECTAVVPFFSLVWTLARLIPITFYKCFSYVAAAAAVVEIVYVASLVSSGLRASGWVCFRFEGDQNCCC